MAISGIEFVVYFVGAFVIVFALGCLIAWQVRTVYDICRRRR